MSQQLLPPGWIDAVSHATIDMNIKGAPSLRYSNLFWAIPDKHVYMMVGYHCQLIMVFPHSDIVAAVTARDFCSFGKVADLISGALRSETALPENPEAAGLLAKAVSEIATEKRSEIDATPPLAAAISGKTYQFPDSPLGVRSLTLTLADAEPRYKIHMIHPTGASIWLDGPIGLDGLYRKGDPTVFGLQAVKGSWSNEQTFTIDFQFLGQGEQRRWSLRFDGDKVTLSGKDGDGRDISVAAAPGGWLVPYIEQAIRP
jgi:hypothetical protein